MVIVGKYGKSTRGYIWLKSDGKLVGKYTSPMDPMDKRVHWLHHTGWIMAILVSWCFMADEIIPI